MNLKYAVKYSEMISFSKWITTLDNESVHKFKQTLRTIEHLNLGFVVLPVYSAILSPVELFFGITKSRLRINIHNSQIWFNLFKKRIKIYKAIKNQHKSWIIKMCIQFIKNEKD